VNVNPFKTSFLPAQITNLVRRLNRLDQNVAQPDAIAPAEFAAHGRDLQLKLAVVMPGPLNPRAVDQAAFAKQLAGFIPLPADAVKQSGSVWFFAGQNSILMPGADGAVPATLSQGHLLAELTVSIILALNGAAHLRSSTPGRSAVQPFCPPNPDNRSWFQRAVTVISRMASQFFNH